MFRYYQHPIYRPVGRIVYVHIHKRVYGCSYKFMASMLIDEDYHRPRLHYCLHHLITRNTSFPDQSSPLSAHLTPQMSWLWDSVGLDHSNLAFGYI